MRKDKIIAAALCICLSGTGCATAGYNLWESKATRRSNYVESHPGLSFKTKKRISEGTIWIGMTKEQMIASRGRPKDINRTVGSFGIHEQWCYGKYGGYGDEERFYVYFKNGILTSWQD